MPGLEETAAQAAAQAEAEAALKTDIDRIQKMIDDTIKGKNNEHTTNVLAQAQARLESELEFLKQDSADIRRQFIDDATTQLIAFENEANVSKELKAAIQNSRNDLVNVRKAVI